MDTTESSLRDRLGIPRDARRVLILAETSHWDPNWLWTSEEYYADRVRHTMDKALDELAREPRRVFSLECVFFLRMYWDRRPERRAEIRDRLNDGRLRLTGTGLTTPDTVLPPAEAILRDFLLGREWLRSVGVTQDPSLAYLPDDFGHSPALPSLLRALGLRHAAISRIDGMSFPGDDWRFAGHYPRPGSSAERLLDEKSLDFVWRGPDGAEVLAHWHAFTYFMGDLLASRGVIRWMGRTFGWADRGTRNVAGKIDGFARRLEAVSRTPYLLCPVGCDFNDPIPGLLDLVDRYNRQRYPDTGTWVVNAGQDDHFALVETHRDRLPVLDLDPNPYWMGFCASRPPLKARCRSLHDRLVRAETALVSALHRDGRAAGLGVLRRGWERLAATNHHDFVTGTAPDRVLHGEQEAWLKNGEECVSVALAANGAGGVAAIGDGVGPGTLASVLDPLPVEWSWVVVRAERRPMKADEGPGDERSCLEVRTSHYTVRLDPSRGGCAVSWLDRRGRERLSGPSLDLVAWDDSGGLWRLGHEFRGGTFREIDRASSRPAAVTPIPAEGGLAVRVVSVLDGRAVTRTCWFRGDSPRVEVRVEGTAARRRTVTVSLQTKVHGAVLDMDVPGGVVRRPPVREVSPTFWAPQRFVHAVAPDGAGVAVVPSTPCAVSVGGDGRVDWVVLRNAPRERAWRFLPVLAHPAWGTCDETHGATVEVAFTGRGDWRDNGLHRRHPDDPVAGAVRIEAGDARLAAFKLAEDGRGVVARIESWDREPVRLSWPGVGIGLAWSCDALERDGEAIAVRDGQVTFQPAGFLSSVRILPAIAPGQALRDAPLPVLAADPPGDLPARG